MAPVRPSPANVKSNASRPGKRSADIVDPLWLAKTSLAVIAISLVCAYLTFCCIFYVAQWQLVLHPSRTVARTPASVGLAFQPVRFGDDRSGQPQLTGWWIPGDNLKDPTILLLHGEDGSMSDTLPAAVALHQASLNVFIFDYRGYGASGGKHPTEQTMRRDADTALNYLTQDRGLTAGNIVVYGTHLGASLAVSLSEKHPQLAALILQSADGDTETRVRRDVRSRIVPVSILFHQRFPLADALHRLATPKLLLSYTQGPPPEEAQRAADPKMTVELPRDGKPTELTGAIRRFLDTYLAHPAPLL